MKTLADQILDMVGSQPVTAASVSAALAVTTANARDAMVLLNEQRRADLVRIKGSRERFVVPLFTRGPDLCNICTHCGAEYVRPAKSKRTTCSRACAMSAGWGDADSRARRLVAISAAQSTPEALARTAETNRKRWARKGERETLAEANRRRWADPITKAKMSRGIRKVNQSEESRAKASRIRREHWADPDKRAKMEAGIRRSKGSPEARAKFSALQKARWQNPVLRAKYMAAAKENSKKGGAARRRKAAACGVLATFPLGNGEERLPIAEMMRRYPPPRPVAGDLPPGPDAPASGGVARELEVA